MERKESGGDTTMGQHSETPHAAARLESVSIDCLPKLIVPARRKRAVSQLRCLSGYLNFPPLSTSPQESLAQSPPCTHVHKAEMLRRQMSEPPLKGQHCGSLLSSTFWSL